MSVLEFIASLFSSLGWPVAAVALALIFRRPLLAILGKLVQRMEALTTVKAGVFEAVFAEARPDLLPPAGQAKRERGLERRSVSESDVLAPKQRGLIERARVIADVDPRAAVLTAARALDLTLEQVMGDLNIQPTGAYGRDIWQLWDIGAIEPTDANRLTELRQLRNVAAHETADDISTESALDYADAVESMMTALKEAEKRPPSSPEGQKR
jgi:hypothetical protein